MSQRKAGEKTIANKLQEDLLASGVEISVAGAVLLAGASIVAGYLIAYLITGNPKLSVIGFIAGFIVPRIWQNYMIEGRRNAFNLQFEQILSKMSGHLQAGMNLEQSLRYVTSSASEPSREVFNIAIECIETGDDISTALKKAAQRIRSRDMEMFATAVSINTQFGGDLSMVLRKMEKGLRNRRNFSNQLKAATAEGNLTAMVMAAMPFTFLGFMRWQAPEMVEPLFNTLIGNIVFGVCVIMIIVGVKQIKSMTNFSQ